MSRINVLRIVVALVLVLSVTVPVFAQQYGQISPESVRCSGPSSYWIIEDTFLMRPAGIIAMGVGAAVAVVAFPFAAMSNSVDRLGQRMFVEPYEFTWVRPLGDLDYGCDQELMIK
jgi:Zn-dependent protease